MRATAPISSMVEARENKIIQFLIDHNCDTDLSGKMGNDASFRTYYRLKKPPHLLLMDSPAAHEPVAPFVLIANHLRELGLSAPEIIAQDLDNNMLLIEDFGDDTFARLIAKGEARAPLYKLAVDALIALHNETKASWIDIPNYTTEKLIEETERTINWYYPVATGKRPDAALKQRWRDAWRAVFEALPEPETSLVLRDYHCDNLMYLKTRKGAKACGLLDFQDALIGPAAYDLVSLLENDRIAVDEDLQAEMVDYYLNTRAIKDRENFMAWYRVLGTQRQMKILGLFYRLYIRDEKQSYLAFIPQVIKLIEQGLKSPLLSPVAELMDEVFPSLKAYKDSDLDVELLRQMGLNDD